MLKFLVRRAFFIILVSIFIVFFIFLGMGMARNSDLQEPNFDLVAHSLTAWTRTQTFFDNARQGEWGSFQSDAGEVPLTEFVREAYVNSMGLLLTALAGSVIVGLILGSAAALSKRSSLSLLTITVLGISAPSFFAALLLQQGAIRYQDAFQQRLVSVAGFGWDVEHMLLPVLVLAARPLAYLTRSAFISLDHVMRQDYIRTAAAKGLRRSGIVLIHAFKNVSVPMFTAVSVSLRFSLSSLPVVEFFFAWPGMGLRLIEAINGRQAQVVAALAFIMGLTFLIVNLVLDLIYRLIDPRLRTEE